MLRHFIRTLDQPPDENHPHPHVAKLASRAALVLRICFVVILIGVIFMYIYHHFYTGDKASSEKMTNLASHLLYALALHNNGVVFTNQTLS